LENFSKGAIETALTTMWGLEAEIQLQKYDLQKDGKVTQDAGMGTKDHKVKEDFRSHLRDKKNPKD
jgi:hypothetical protein